MPYTTATLISKDTPFDDGRVRITVEFTGAGETAKRLTYTVDGHDTFATIRNWIDQQAVRLDPVKTVVDSLALGQQVAVRAIVPPAPTAEAIWRGKVGRYLAAKELNLTGGTAVADRNALLADIEATYLPAYL